jgi:hypothetical protein
MELPLKKIPALLQDPKNLILYGLPKVGKTTLLSQLEDNLIIDTENGSDYVDALKVKVKSIEDIIDLCKSIKEAGMPYKFATIDTISALEDMCAPLALKRYIKDFPDYEGELLDIPFGGGYSRLRQAILDVIAMINKVVPRIIVVGHVKDKVLKKVDDSGEAVTRDINLTGKTSDSLVRDSDAIGFIFRDIDGNLCVNFTNNGSTIAGARPSHLAGKQIIIAEKQEDGTFTSHWDRIYPSLLEKGKV